MDVVIPGNPETMGVHVLGRAKQGMVCFQSVFKHLIVWTPGAVIGVCALLVSRSSSSKSVTASQIMAALAEHHGLPFLIGFFFGEFLTHCFVECALGTVERIVAIFDRHYLGFHPNTFSVGEVEGGWTASWFIRSCHVDLLCIVFRMKRIRFFPVMICVR
jgi:hypothetical protein